MNMTKIVRTTANLFYPFCLTFGLYVVLHGHLSPGGGFQGGAVMATGMALLLVSRRYGDIVPHIRKNAMTLLEAAGLLLFIGVGVSGLLAGGAFFFNHLAGAGGWFGTAVEHGANGGVLSTGGIVPLLNIAVGVEVLGGLTIILLYMLSGVQEAES